MMPSETPSRIPRTPARAGTLTTHSLAAGINGEMICVNGTEPTSKIAGFMYYAFSEKEPEGFIGPNDRWHYHTNTCIKPAADGLDAPLGADRSVSAAQCTALGGTFIPETGWMVHVWTVPGYEVGEDHGGVFGEVNPDLTCPDGTYQMVQAGGGRFDAEIAPFSLAVPTALN